jgi:hypothetical protein
VASRNYAFESLGIRPLKLPKFPKILIGAAWAGRLSLIAQQLLREIEREATSLRKGPGCRHLTL